MLGIDQHRYWVGDLDLEILRQELRQDYKVFSLTEGDPGIEWRDLPVEWDLQEVVLEDFRV